jgi:hypothetical protein
MHFTTDPFSQPLPRLFSLIPSDFDEMEQIFSQQINPNLDMVEIEASLQEFRNDYNQRHFVRNDTFKVGPGAGRGSRQGLPGGSMGVCQP